MGLSIAALATRRAQQFGHPRDVGGADRDKLVDCIMALAPMTSDLPSDSRVALALHLDAHLASNGHISGRELIGLQLHGEHVVATPVRAARPAIFRRTCATNPNKSIRRPRRRPRSTRPGHEAITWIMRRVIQCVLLGAACCSPNLPARPRRSL